MKGKDGVRAMDNCPGWKLAPVLDANGKEQPSLGQFCRALAKRYPADADIAKLQYCRDHPMDETCDC